MRHEWTAKQLSGARSILRPAASPRCSVSIRSSRHRRSRSGMCSPVSARTGACHRPLPPRRCRRRSSKVRASGSRRRWVCQRIARGLYAVEPGTLGWISFQHYTARPAVDIERRDKQGRVYTDIREVPLQTADPQLHTHVTVFNSVLTDSRRIGAVDLDRLAGRVKELGAVYHAYIAARARHLGIETVLDERTGAARLADLPHSVRELFSKRTIEAQDAARDFAARKGIDWDAITADQKIALLKAGAAETRQAKTETAEGLEQKSDFVVWHEQAMAMSYRHRSVIRPDEITPAPASEQRHEAAYHSALPLLAGSSAAVPCWTARN